MASFVGSGFLSLSVLEFLAISWPSFGEEARTHVYSALAATFVMVLVTLVALVAAYAGRRILPAFARAILNASAIAIACVGIAIVGMEIGTALEKTNSVLATPSDRVLLLITLGNLVVVGSIALVIVCGGWRALKRWREKRDEA